MDIFFGENLQEVRVVLSLRKKDNCVSHTLSPILYHLPVGQKPRVYNTQTSEEKYQDPTDPPPPLDDDCQLLGSEPSTSQDWLNPLTHLRRLFGFYVIDGTVRQRAEMIIFLLIFMFPVANEINLGAIDALYQVVLILIFCVLLLN